MYLDENLNLDGLHDVVSLIAEAVEAQRAFASTL